MIPVRAPRGKLVVVLSAAPNPDYEERMWEGSVSIPPQKQVVADLREASNAVRKFILSNNLGGGNWTGGQVYDDVGRQVALISYNGRAWEPGRWPTPEIKPAASLSRAQVAANVQAALESALRRAPSAWDADPVEVDGLRVRGSYRSDLPKEGAYEVGEYRYEEMVRAEIAAWRRFLDPLLAPHMAGIASVRVYAGEKSWIYTEVRLK